MGLLKMKPGDAGTSIDPIDPRGIEDKASVSPGSSPWFPDLLAPS